MKYEEFCEKFDIKLNDEQMMAVRKTEGPTLMISVPGSGKTTVIVARIGYMILCAGIKASEILTVTFSVEAARSMTARFEAKFGNIGDKPEFRTVHSMSLKIIKYYCRLYHKKPHSILNGPEVVIRKIVESQLKTSCSDDLLREVLAQINKAKNLMYDEERNGSIAIGKVDFAGVFKAYEEYKKSHRLMDFDDMMIFALQILNEVPAVLSAFQERYRYFNVDEAQDNSLIQNRIMQVLSSKTNNLFMVGDEDQCIYGFRGAYPRSFFEFQEKWGEENIIKLETNYRSCDAILRQAEEFISQNKNRYHKNLRGVKNREGSLEVRGFKSIRERNAYIAKDCSKYDTAAVLSRNNFSLVSVACYMGKNGIDFSIKAGKNDFFDGSPIMDIISILKVGTGQRNVEMTAEVMRFLERQNENRIHRIGDLNSLEAVRFIVDEMHYDKFLVGSCGEGIHMNGIYTRLNILESVAAESEGIESLIDDIDKINKICAEGRAGKHVSLLTCHGSKGLEFDKVYIIDVNEGLFPACEKDEENFDEYEEEVRLFYVAVTRAIEECEVLTVKSAYYGKAEKSRFVREIGS